MSDSRNSWAEKDRRRHLIDERKFMWQESQLDEIARMAGFRPGMRVADIGCGLGYLGMTYWRYLNPECTYTGVDCSSELVVEAEELSREWAPGGTACFLNGDAYSLPFPDNSFDAVMCQTLLIHLEYPDRAVSEMVRVTKSGGTVLIKDVDNVSHTVMRNLFSREEEPSIETVLFLNRMHLLWARGRKALGKGDWGIGTKLTELMHNAGLVSLHGVFNQRMEFLVPGGDSPEQCHRIEQMRKAFREKSSGEEAEDRDRAKRDYREYYIAGGGDPDSFESDYSRLYDIFSGRREHVMQQLAEGTLFSCAAGNTFRCVTGRKRTHRYRH